MPTLNNHHTWLALGLASVLSLPVEGQTFYKNHFLGHSKFYDMDRRSGIGLVDGSMNYPETITGGLEFSYYKNFKEWENASLSLGTNIRIGAENGKGWGAPDVVAMGVGYLVAGALGIDATDLDINTSTLGWYSELPVMVQYSFGLGSTEPCTKRFGFFIGVGYDFVATAFTDNQNHPQATGFIGYCLTAGIRLAKHLEISITQVKTLTPTLGPITNYPAQYDLTIAYFNFIGRHP